MTKRIFISDIHLGDGEKYCQFNDQGRISALANFLNEQHDSDEVAEVVILGDLFDTWYIPADKDPLDSFEKIYSNNKYEPVKAAMKKLAKGRKLIYIPGNHDCVFSGIDQQKAKDFLESSFDGIRYNPDPNNLLEGVYNAGTIWAEHGNRYALFNAPNNWTNPYSFLPIGYFITRLVAYKVCETGFKDDPHETFINFIKGNLKDSIPGSEYIYDLLIAVAEDAGLNKSEFINMKKIPGFPETEIDKIGEIYNKDFIGLWEKNREDLTWPEAIVGDIGELVLAAARIHDREKKPNIIIFGHTHKPEIWKEYNIPYLDIIKDLFSDNSKLKDYAFTKLKLESSFVDKIKNLILHWKKTKDDFFQNIGKLKDKIDYIKNVWIVKDIHMDLPCRMIYANCGTWADAKKPCTYVETQEDKGRHYVRLFSYDHDKKKKLFEEEYVEL